MIGVPASDSVVPVDEGHQSGPGRIAGHRRRLDGGPGLGLAERKTDTKGCGWDVGGRVDYLFGVDGPQTQAFGDHSLDFGWNTSSHTARPSAGSTGRVAYNDLKVKLGHFYTPIGYEVVQRRRTSSIRTPIRTPSASRSPTPASGDTPATKR